MERHYARWVATATVALALVTTAAASNSASFADPAGDAASAPDVTSVAVSNDDAGTITFKLGIGNRAALGPQDWVVIGLDTDTTEDAEGYLTAEYALSYGSDGPALARRDGEAWQDLFGPLLTSFGGSFASGVVTLTVNQTDIDDASGLNFWILGGTDADESRDDAPDGNDVWEYRVMSPALYVLTFQAPKSAVQGKRLVAGMKVRGASPEQARLICSATVAGKRVVGVGDWFRITMFGRTTAQPRCTWMVPKKTKGKLLRGTMTVVQSGLQVGRSFSLRIR